MAREARKGNEGFLARTTTKSVSICVSSVARIFFRLKLFAFSMARHVA
jgi:hypothetical protein